MTRRSLSRTEWMYLALATALFTLVSAQSLGMIGNPPSPSALAPGGLPLSIVALLFSAFGTPWVPVLMVSAFFLCVELFVMMNDGLPTRTNAFFVGIVAILSASFIALSWNDDHNRHYTVAVALLSALFGTSLLLLLVFIRRNKSAASTLLVHLMLAAWVTTYAFPCLGETL